MESKSKDPFSDLEFFNDARFQPPEWAKDFPVASSSSSSRRPGPSGHADDLRPPPSTHPAFAQRAPGASGASDVDAPGDVDEDEEEGEDIWADAQEEIHEPPEVKDPTKEFTADELHALLEQATKLKDQGNASYASKPPSYEDAIVAYTRAIEYLPPMPKRPSETARGKAREESPLRAAGAAGGGGGLVEVTDAEAEEIERERLGEKSAKRVLEDAQDAVRECEKACWGNLGACHVALKDDKAAVEACTKALEIDPTYIKALQRRAAANDRIGSWSSLTAAQDDYAALLTLLPPSSPLAPPIRKSLNALPGRIKVQQEKEKDEMLGKLKELGNGILGRFGLSTDMFKFEQQPGGGYNMSFQQG